MIDGHPYESIPAYVLGALDPKEANWIGTHLAVCAICRAEAEAFRASLVESGDTPGPRRHIRQRLMARIARDRPLRVPAESGPLPRRLAHGIPGSLLVFGLILGMLALLLPGSIEQGRLRLLIAAPETSVYSMLGTEQVPYARGTVYLQATDRRVGLVLSNLPPAPPGHTYRLWLANEQASLPARSFAVRSDGSAELLVTAPQTIEHYMVLMVTLEPVDGANGPGERIVLQMQL